MRSVLALVILAACSGGSSPKAPAVASPDPVVPADARLPVDSSPPRSAATWWCFHTEQRETSSCVTSRAACADERKEEEFDTGPCIEASAAWCVDYRDTDGDDWTDCNDSAAECRGHEAWVTGEGWTVERACHGEGDDAAAKGWCFDFAQGDRRCYHGPSKCEVERREARARACTPAEALWCATMAAFPQEVCGDYEDVCTNMVRGRVYEHDDTIVEPCAIAG